MKPKLTKIAAPLIVAGLSATSVAAFATNISALPPAHVQGDVEYITGGIGEDEANAIMQAAATYPLELLFAQKALPRDEYIADVNVTIRDAAGKPVLRTTSNGPFLLAKLPAGKYEVQAEYEGQLKRQAVDIRPGKHQRGVFVWTAHNDSAGKLSGN